MGILNYEVSSFEQCLNRSLVVTEINGYDCELNKVSCKFIELFNSKGSYIELVNSLLNVIH